MHSRRPPCPGRGQSSLIRISYSLLTTQPTEFYFFAGQPCPPNAAALATFEFSTERPPRPWWVKSLRGARAGGRMRFGGINPVPSQNREVLPGGPLGFGRFFSPTAAFVRLLPMGGILLQPAADRHAASSKIPSTRGDNIRSPTSRKAEGIAPDAGPVPKREFPPPADWPHVPPPLLWPLAYQHYRINSRLCRWSMNEALKALGPRAGAGGRNTPRSPKLSPRPE